jgi:hypothetical protein
MEKVMPEKHGSSKEVFEEIVEKCEELVRDLEEHADLEDERNQLDTELYYSLNKDIPFERCSLVKRLERIEVLEQALQEAQNALKQHK